jgi:hypothetical protein
MKADKNPQRYKNYWEPIYNPSINQFNIWNPDEKVLEQTTGIKEVSFNIEICKTLQLKRLTDKTFENIDFKGELDGGQRKFTFKNCRFNYCSFRETIFINIKFTNCKFNHTSFTFGKFVNCEFRDCSFTKIGISGNATYLENIYVNPIAFLRDFYLMKDKSVLKENNSNLLLQWFMLEKTRSNIARKLAEMQSIRRNIDFHINSIKTSRKYEILSWLKKSIYFLIKGSFFQKAQNLINLIYYALEYPTMMFFGWLSGWGNKIGKTLMIGLISLIILSKVNNYLIFQDDTFISSVLKTSEYWLLFGYTKYDFDKIPENIQWIIFGNSLLGMIWFAALIPIIINKLGKNDE